MESSNFLNEAEVRQAWIDMLVTCLGYPRSLMVVERQLRSLPHLTSMRKLPNRRIDLLVMARDIHPLYPIYPLLMVEFKWGALSSASARQALGYNTYVQAPFIALANGQEVLFGQYQGDTVTFSSVLPSFIQLIQWTRTNSILTPTKTDHAFGNTGRDQT